MRICQSGVFLFSLALLDSAIATRLLGVAKSSPGIFGKKGKDQRYHNEHALLCSLRGGSTLDGEAHIPPRINAETMSLALRWTGEVNRWLSDSTLSRTPSSPVPLVEDAQFSSPSRPDAVRGGGMVQTNTEATTIFHAKSPVGTGRGAARWGPDLQDFVEHLIQHLGLSADSPELSLALIYLDRASSLDTPRSNGIPAVPYLQPRTAHRLVLTALLWATQITRRTPMPVLMEAVQGLVNPTDLMQMLEWMQAALGDPGFFVTTYSLTIWRHVLAQTERLKPALAFSKSSDQTSDAAVCETSSIRQSKVGATANTEDNSPSLFLETA